MPFGKFRGLSVAELPDDYLSWLGNGIAQGPLAMAILRELKKRQQAEGTEPALPVAVPKEHRAAVAEIVRRGYRAAAASKLRQVPICSRRRS
jgi:uncharacterized protein (DUF3820 family)